MAPCDNYDHWLAQHHLVHKPLSTNLSEEPMNTYTQYKIITTIIPTGYDTSAVTDPTDLNDHLREGWSINSHHVFCEAGRIIHTFSLSRTTTERDEQDTPPASDPAPDEAAPAPLAAAIVLECHDAPPVNATQAAFDAAGQFVPAIPAITITPTPPPTSYRDALTEMAAGRMTWQQVAAIGDAEALAAAAESYYSRKLYVQE